MKTTSARPYRKVARAAGEERTRAALLDAAERRFFEDGTDGASLAAVAAEAGVTKQTLLRHFGSKDGLREQAFARAFERVRNQRWDVPGDDVEQAVDNLLDHYDEVGDRALKIDAMAGAAPVADWVRRSRELHYDWVDRAFGGLLADHCAEDRARRRAALIALCDVHAWWTLSHHLGLDRGEVRATLLLAVRGVLEDGR